MTERIDSKIILKDTSTNFISTNEVFRSGIMCYEIDTNKIKFSDGITDYNNLPYIAVESVDYDDVTNKPTINGVTVEGDLTLNELGIVSISDLNGYEKLLTAGYGIIIDRTVATTPVISTVKKKFYNTTINATGNVGDDFTFQIVDLNLLVGSGNPVVGDTIISHNNFELIINTVSATQTIATIVSKTSAGSWGTITGTISSQTDLYTILTGLRDDIDDSVLDISSKADKVGDFTSIVTMTNLGVTKNDLDNGTTNMIFNTIETTW